MKRKQIFVVACALLMLTGTIAVAGKAGIGGNFFGFGWLASQQASNSVLQNPEVTYEIFFRKLIKFEKDAEAKEKKGEPAAHFRSYAQRKYNLSEADAETLHTIARETIQNLAPNERSAMLIINNIRGQFPNGGIPDGTPLPTPPPQLETLQAEREQIVLAGRDRLHTELGDAQFYSLEEILQQQTQAGMQAVGIKPRTLEEKGE